MWSGRCESSVCWTSWIYSVRGATSITPCAWTKKPTNKELYRQHTKECSLEVGSTQECGSACKYNIRYLLLFNNPLLIWVCQYKAYISIWTVDEQNHQSISYSLDWLAFSHHHKFFVIVYAHKMWTDSDHLQSVHVYNHWDIALLLFYVVSFDP